MTTAAASFVSRDTPCQLRAQSLRNLIDAGGVFGQGTFPNNLTVEPIGIPYKGKIGILPAVLCLLRAFLAGINGGAIGSVPGRVRSGWWHRHRGRGEPALSSGAPAYITTVGETVERGMSSLGREGFPC